MVYCFCMMTCIMPFLSKFYAYVLPVYHIWFSGISILSIKQHVTFFFVATTEGATTEATTVETTTTTPEIVTICEEVNITKISEYNMTDDDGNGTTTIYPVISTSIENQTNCYVVTPEETTTPTIPSTTEPYDCKYNLCTLF